MWQHKSVGQHGRGSADTAMGWGGVLAGVQARQSKQECFLRRVLGVLPVSTCRVSAPLATIVLLV
jgi:hypothetical protein